MLNLIPFYVFNERIKHILVHKREYFCEKLRVIIILNLLKNNKYIKNTSYDWFITYAIHIVLF